LAGAGAVAGILAAFALVRLIESLLVGVKPYDMATFLAAPVVLALVAGLAIWFPAARASQVDPMTALRVDG